MQPHHSGRLLHAVVGHALRGLGGPHADEAHAARGGYVHAPRLRHRLARQPLQVTEGAPLRRGDQAVLARREPPAGDRAPGAQAGCLARANGRARPELHEPQRDDVDGRDQPCAPRANVCLKAFAAVTAREGRAGVSAARPFRLRAVLFDFDGTLTHPGALDFAAIKREVGCPPDQFVLEWILALPDGADARRRSAHPGALRAGGRGRLGAQRRRRGARPPAQARPASPSACSRATGAAPSSAPCAASPRSRWPTSTSS